jgi:hypothetical protein
MIGVFLISLTSTCFVLVYMQVLDDPRYRQAAVAISAKLQAQAAARHPMARAADAVEELLQGQHGAGLAEAGQGSAATEGDAGEL